MKIGQFIYSWGNGHYSRMMSLNEELPNFIKDYESHYSSKEEIYQKLLERFPKENVHETLTPTPIDGKYGPDVFMSMLNTFLPIQGRPPVITQVASYLRKERELFDRIKFDLVINDGDMGPNILAKNRNIPSIFVTNEFKPKLWKSRFYFYPGVLFVAKQIANAIKNQPLNSFNYRDKGSMATIGRHKAVVEVGPIRLSGVIAWYAWLWLHLFYLIGGRNKIGTMADWTWNYLTFDRGNRHIMDIN